MQQRLLLAKKNSDGSYSVSYPANHLIEDSFVDFYNEQTGGGFQRQESNRTTRGNQVAAYLARCKKDGIHPKLFELTANARVGCRGNGGETWNYEGLDEQGRLGFLTFAPQEQKPWLSLIDGGTRHLGIERAYSKGDIGDGTTIDVRIFVNLSLAQEIAQFLLINDYQKKVRTDLALRVVQRRLDQGNLSDDEMKALTTAVPDTDSWKFEASRIATAMNTSQDSPWLNRIQMPSAPPSNTTLQSFFTSLRPILTDDDIKATVTDMVHNGDVLDPFTFHTTVLKNFWSAVAAVNPAANDEPFTNVLWAPIGSSACHIALAAILKTILLGGAEIDMTKKRFIDMLQGSSVAEYPYWFTKKGNKSDEYYPAGKGDATLMTGAANYKRLAKDLETAWRANLHARPGRPAVRM